MTCDRVAVSLGIGLALLAVGCGMAERPTKPPRPGAAARGQDRPSKTATEGPRDLAALGKSLFRSQGCMNCHRYKGQGSPTPGPELDTAGRRRDVRRHREHLIDPASKITDSEMPDYAHLKPEELDALAHWLAGL